MNNKGFTLMEIVVTAVILGVLCTITLPNFSKMIGGGYAKDAATKLSVLYAFQQAYAMDNGGAYLAAREGLKICINDLDTKSGIDRCVEGYGGMDKAIEAGKKMPGADYQCVGPRCKAFLPDGSTMKIELNEAMVRNVNIRSCTTGDNPCII